VGPGSGFAINVSEKECVLNGYPDVVPGTELHLTAWQADQAVG